MAETQKKCGTGPFPRGPGNRQSLIVDNLVQINVDVAIPVGDVRAAIAVYEVRTGYK